jgi:hypothetical protein
VKTTKSYGKFSEHNCSGETSVYFLFRNTKLLNKILASVPVEDGFRCITSSHFVYRNSIVIL